MHLHVGARATVVLRAEEALIGFDCFFTPAETLRAQADVVVELGERREAGGGAEGGERFLVARLGESFPARSEVVLGNLGVRRRIGEHRVCELPRWQASTRKTSLGRG